MLTSVALLFLVGLAMGRIFAKLKLPSLLGMIITGIILSPYALNLLDPKLLDISADLRQVALIIILTRAGLSLDLNDLKKVGRPAILLCFVPASLEILGMVLFGPTLLGVTVLEAAIIGSVIAAVSPAVVVPRMLKLIEEGYGTDKSIPQMIVAGASVDDVFVIVLFTAFTSLAVGGNLSPKTFVGIPISIVLGVILGVLMGLSLHWFFQKVQLRSTIKVIITLCISFFIIEFQNQVADMVSISGLLAIMSMGITLNKKSPIISGELSTKYNQLWVAAEVILFVLVGATVDLNYLAKAGVVSVIALLSALLFRMTGVFICLLKTNLNQKERSFCMVAYTPKATVQAAIGAIPLSMGLACGHQVLTIAVLSILITAPFGAICVDTLYKKLLLKHQ